MTQSQGQNLPRTNLESRIIENSSKGDQAVSEKYQNLQAPKVFDLNQSKPAVVNM